MNEKELCKLCQQSIVDYPLIDDWLLWYFLTKFYGIRFDSAWQAESIRKITESELAGLTKAYKKQQDRKSMPKFLFDKIYNKPIPDDIWLESDKWRKYR